MIVNSLIRCLAGTVSFEASNGFGERLINLCTANNVSLWKLQKTEEGFAACCSARDYKRVCEFAGRVNVELTETGRKGLFYHAGKYRRRWGLFLGIAVFFVFLFLSQCFIWDIQIEGNTTVPTAVILNELEGIGIKKLAFIPELDLLVKKQEALLKLPQLSWLAINKSGCRITVSVTERKMPPTLSDKTPCDIVAARTGQIRYMEVYSGRQLVEENYTVREGELLVAGTYEGEEGDITLVHSDARIIAEVQFDKTLSLDIDQLAKEYTGQEKTRYYLNLFSLRIPLFVALPVNGDYDKSLSEHPVTVFGQELPIGIDSVHYRFYEKKPDAMTQSEAIEVLRQSFRQYEAIELQGSSILDRQIKTRQEKGVCSMTISYTVEQDIAKKKAIVTE